MQGRLSPRKRKRIVGCSVSRRSTSRLSRQSFGGLCAIDFDRDEYLAAFLRVASDWLALEKIYGEPLPRKVIEVEEIGKQKSECRNEGGLSLQISPPREEREQASAASFC